MGTSLAVSGDIAAWRLLEGETHPRERFDPLWKLAYMWEHPLHFPLAAWTALTVWGDRPRADRHLGMAGKRPRLLRSTFHAKSPNAVRYAVITRASCRREDNE